MTSGNSPRMLRKHVAFSMMYADIDYLKRTVVITVSTGDKIDVSFDHLSELGAILESVGHQAPGTSQRR